MTGRGYLLDTHAAIWWWTENPRLGRQAAEMIGAGEAPVYVSAASVWEIAIKSQAGKLDEIDDFEGQYPELMRSNGFIRLPVEDRHALRAGSLEGRHRDPFDRLIAAQGFLEKLTVVTRDKQVAGFGCEVLW
ncbi:MAG TPA: type II toxin-antitoxin system VapC family toxin [Sphingomonas sp.]